MSRPKGYFEFEFDLPSALLARLIAIFDDIDEIPLSAKNLKTIPDDQGVYELFIVEKDGPKLAYIGKTDSKHGLRNRLIRHSEKVQHRKNLDPRKVFFKAVRIFVFTAMDLEKQLIEHYAKTVKAKAKWNGSGFGSNDVGIERDTTKYKKTHFDFQYPIDITRPLTFRVPKATSAFDAAQMLKRKLPYTFRFQMLKPKSHQPHPDLAATMVTLDPAKHTTPETMLAALVSQLPKGWKVTKLPSHIIMYKNDRRKILDGTPIGKSPGTR